ncbi:MAG: Gfo/Idh/MocA family oxidoreductase [Chloroflexota bacterium]
MNAPLKVAFLGARHPHIFPRLTLCLAAPGVRVVGVYDTDPQLAAQIGEKYGVPVAQTVDDLFREGMCDLVIIEGHDPENPSYVQQALGRTRSLLIEKPGAANLADMEQMVGMIEGAGVHAQLGYMYNYSPVVPKVEAILKSGVLGPLTLARFHAGSPVGGAAEIWQSVPGDMGGVLYTDGCHMLALVVRLLGAPRSAVGRILKIQDGPEVEADIYKEDTLAGLGGENRLRLGEQLYEDAGAAILEYDNMLATFDVTGWEAHNWVEAWSLEFFGTDGTLQVSLVPPRYRLWIRRVSDTYTKGWHTWEGTGAASGAGASLVVDENYRNEMADLLANLREGSGPDYRALQEGLQVIRITDAIYRTASDAQGHRGAEASGSEEEKEG